MKAGYKHRRAWVACTAAAAVVAGTVAGTVAWSGAAQAAASGPCASDVGGTGLSAAVVAHKGQTIADRTIDTTCDIGIFVGASATHVTIRGVTVTGAGYEGVLAEDTSYLRVEHSTIRANGLRTIDKKAPALPGSGVHSFVGQSFGISLFGVSHGWVRDNTVTGNGRGGIGVMDNGALNPGALTQPKSAKLVGSDYVVVTGNRVSANYNGCAIVAATQNAGGHVSHVWIGNNVIRGTGMSKMGPDVGGIVAAANLPKSWVRDVLISNNRVTDSFEGGVIVNAEAPGTSTANVAITGNRLSGNNRGHLEAPATAGVIVFAAPGTGAINMSTTVAGNSITGQFYGVWSRGKNPPAMFVNHVRVFARGHVISHS